MDNILAAIVFVPIIAGFAMLFTPSRFSKLQRDVTLFISAVALAEAARIFFAEQAQFAWQILQLENLNLLLIFNNNPLQKFILLFAMLFGLLITLYSLRSRTAEDDSRNANIYFGSILLTIGGSAGVLLSNNLLFLLIFWEVVTLSLYLLISTGGKNSNFAATKSFAMIGASDAAFLLGVLMLWRLSGTFIISDIKIATDTPAAIIAFLLLMTAAITKAGAMPLHSWLPVSGEFAPAPVMALLPASIDKLLGIYLLVVMVQQLFELNSQALKLVLMVIGAGTILIANIIAMVQHNLKKLLSYCAITQVGYIILGIASGTPVGIAGGLFHMLNHAIYKSCLFLSGGAVEQQTQTAEIDELGGLGKKMPLTFAAFMIASLSVSGIPPFNGFVSKWMIYQGVIQMGSQQVGTAAELWPLWLIVAMFGSALTLALFVKMLHSLFLSRRPSYLEKVREVGALQYIPMLVLAVLCVLFGVLYSLPLKYFIFPALGFEAQLSLWSAALATIIVLAGIILGLLIWRFGRFAEHVRIVPNWFCGEHIESDRMIVSGKHFYKTVSDMNGLRQFYAGQEKGHYDVYNQSGRAGLLFTGLLKWMHNGVLSVYVTWLIVGLLVVLVVLGGYW